MKIKIDKEKLKKRMQEQEEKSLKRNRDPKESLIVKVSEIGEQLFRAVFYPHSADPSSEPFPERYYHYGFQGGPFYCPQKNEGKDCHVCDFVWSRLIETKGTEAAKEWQQKLPKMCVLIPGLLRGREDEGCKFLRISTREDKPSDNYSKIYGWFMKESTTDWLDFEEGFDMELSYKSPEQGSFVGGAKFILGGIDLSRDSTPFGEGWENFEVPNIDEILFEKKTTEDSLNLLNRFNELLAKRSPRKAISDSELNKELGVTEKKTKPPASTSEDDLTNKLNALGV